ncbi:MAG: MFS transporter [Gammaproteobacteria bacterium]|nr:MAG: MFS transporter [Gammaproteobacteria bacterium]
MTTQLNHKQISTGRLWLLSFTLVLASFMVVVDMTIANVALPHMMGTLGATSEQITWVLTSYTIAEAIFIPLTAYFASRLGERTLLMVSVSGFVIFSILCGQADSLDSMIAYRIAQGMMGASIIPLTQSLMVRYFPSDKKNLAMAIWGIGIMMGPVVGPTLGGYITTYADWRWIFYVNVPIGLLALGLIWLLIEQTKRSIVKIDWIMIIFMALGIGTLQAFLDQGNMHDWFESTQIKILFLLSIIGFAVFIYRAWNDDNSVVPLRLLKDRNLLLSSLLMAILSIALFGTVVIQPLMMEGLMGYPPDVAGLVMMPRGVAEALGMMMAVVLTKYVNVRYVMLIGVTLSVTGSYMMTQLTLIVDQYALIMPSIIQGAGIGMLFVPLSSLAYATLAPEHATNAAAIFNLSRTIGSSMGISLASTIYTRSSQTQWNVLGSNITPYNPQVNEWLSSLNMTIEDPHAPQILANLLQQQSSMVGFLDTFYFIMWCFIVIAPVLFLIKSVKLDRKIELK